MNILYKIYDMSLRVLYPQTCYFCGEISRTAICENCAKKIVYIQEPRCKTCGKPIRYEEKEYCEDCTKRKFYYDQGRSLWIHKGPVAWSVYQFKYHNRRIYGAFYAKELWRLYAKWIKDMEIDVIIPVPLHWRRRKNRGYNQAEIVARHLSRYSGIPMNRWAIKRIRYTERQKNLNNKERRKNLEGAFKITKSWKQVSRVLLVDDIYTTGNTIDEIAKVLKAKGAEKVYFLAISIGQGF